MCIITILFRFDKLKKTAHTLNKIVQSDTSDHKNNNTEKIHICSNKLCPAFPCSVHIYFYIKCLTGVQIQSCCRGNDELQYVIPIQ